MVSIAWEAVYRLTAGPIRFRLPPASMANPPPRPATANSVLLVLCVLLFLPAVMFSADPSALVPSIFCLWVVVNNLQAFNILAGGKRNEHIELRRNDEVYLDAVGAERVPDPTIAGDFCRRFYEAQVLDLMDAINEARLRVWSEQPPEFFTLAIIEGDGTWGYHPLVISLTNRPSLSTW